MSEVAVRTSATSLPSIFTARPESRTRLHDFFSSHIRNPNTRRAYREAVRQFSAFCAEHGIGDLAQVQPIHVAAFVETQLKLHSKPTVKLRLAALRMLFDWMVVGQVVPANPAHAVRGPKHSQRRGKTPVLQADEARTLLDAIDTTSLPGLRDRALIGLMVYTFARVGAAVSMRVEDFFVQGRRGWVRLHEKGGKEHEMPTHHNLDRYLEEYIRAAGIAEDRKSPLFRTTRGRSGELTANSLRSAATLFGRPASRFISKTAANWRLQSRWPRTSPQELLGYMIGAMTKSRLTRLSGSESDALPRQRYIYLCLGFT
jgi:site-specific recombinase XerD